MAEGDQHRPAVLLGVGHRGLNIFIGVPWSGHQPIVVCQTGLAKQRPFQALKQIENVFNPSLAVGLLQVIRAQQNADQNHRAAHQVTIEAARDVRAAIAAGDGR